MLPGYGYMHSFPQQGIPMPFMHYYQSNGEDVPSKTMIHPSKYGGGYGSYPYGGYYGSPAPWDTSFNNSSFPGYVGYRPPCHYPPSPYLCCGSHNFFPRGYPIQYFPPPYYGMELPRYEYDKIVPKEYHCCGCPHKSNQNHEKGLKIEEEEPDSGNGSFDSLVPFQLKNCPNSVVWMPKQYTDGKDCGMPVAQLKVATENSNSGNGRYPEKYVEEEPRKLKGWFPFDLNGMKSLMRDGGTELSQEHENQNNLQFPFPNLGMPPYDEQEVAQKARGEVESGHSSVPLSGSNASLPDGLSSHSFVQPSGNRLNRTRSLGADESTDCLMSNKENSTSSLDSNMSNNISTVRDIPVKCVEVDKHEKREDVAERTEDDALRKPSSKERQGRVDSEGQSKDAKSSEKTKRQSMSPPRSKLPPVCLRVDPLPKKKASKGSPHSPPDHRGQLNEKPQASSLSLEVGSRENLQPGSPVRSNEGGPKRKNKTIQVMERMDNNSGKNGDDKPAPDLPNTGEAATVLNKGKSKNADKSSGRGSINNEVKGVSALADGKRLSDEQAAVRIQSVYRGYEVRRWEPLKNIKQIIKLREQMDEVERQIETLASSSGLRKDCKEEMATGERIMSLLLELDKIQGLHPSLREIRKSVARDLVTLQEKLDSIMLNRNEPDRVSAAKHTEDDSTNMEKESCDRGRESNKRGETGTTRGAEGCHCQPTLDAKNDAELLSAPYSAVVSQGEVASGPFLVDQQSYSESEVVTNQEQATCDIEIAQPDTVVEPNGIAAKQLGVSENVMAGRQEKGDKDLETGQELEFSSSEDINSSAPSKSLEHPSDQPCSADLPDNVTPAALVNMVEKLPVRVLDDDAIYDPNKEIQVGLSEEYSREEDMNLMNEGSSSHPWEGGFAAKVVDDAPPVLGNERDTQSGINSSYAMGTELVLSEGDSTVGKRTEEVYCQDNLDTHTEGGQQGKEMPSENGELKTEQLQGREVNGSNYSAVFLEQEGDESSILQMESKNDVELLETAPTGNKHSWRTDVNGEDLNRKQEQAFTMKNSDYACYVSDKHVGLDDAQSLVDSSSDSFNVKVDIYNVRDDTKEELCSQSPTDWSCEMKTSNSGHGNETADKETTVAGELNLERIEETGNSIEVAPGEQKMAHTNDQKEAEENGKLKEMMEKLIQSGGSELDVINYLNGRVKDLEKKLAKRRHLKIKRMKRGQCGTSVRK